MAKSPVHPINAGLLLAETIMGLFAKLCGCSNSPASPALLDVLVTIQNTLLIQNNKLDTMAKSLDNLITLVNEQSTVVDSVVVLITDLKAQVAAAAGDQAKIDEIFDKVLANQTDLSTAITANTPNA